MWSSVLGRRLEAELGIDALNSYGLSEIIGPGVAAECREGRDGMHVNEDHFLAEVINPQTGEPVADGDYGELVLTTLTREAMPLVRYRTGDITSMSTEPCVCGRTTARIGRILGRRQDVLSVGDAHLFPSQIERVLLSEPGVGLKYQLVLGHEQLTVHCEPLDAFTNRADLPVRVEIALCDRLGLEAHVSVDERGSLPRTAGKAVRVQYAGTQVQ